MMVQRRVRRNREFRGPAPSEVAIMARPTNKHAPEKLILESRRMEAERNEAIKQMEYNKLCDIKNDWERWTDRKIQLNTVHRRVKGMMQQQQFSLEERRERLRNLLAREEQEYIAEMESKEETVLERQAKMRERAKHLKEKRELERLAVVEEKLDQRWREQCEELRSTLSKREQDRVCVERLEQLRVKEQIEADNKEQDKIYAELWHEDMLAKAEKEEQQAKALHERNKEVLAYLQMQMKALDQQKEEALRLKAEEAQILKEQATLRKIEEQKAREEKARVQAETRHMYDLSLRMKMKKQAKEVQEQLAFDMKILEQLLEETRNEALEQAQRKKELREEDRRYRQYLQDMMEEEKRRDAELDRIIDSEVEAMWQKRLKQWRLEKEARQKLLQEVMAVREKQLAEKLMANERAQEEARRERENIKRIIEENKRIEEQQKREMWERNLRHQDDLDGQIVYNQRLKGEERVEEERMWSAGQDAERDYQRRLKNALDNPYSAKTHPIRLRGSGKARNPILQ